MNSFKNFFKKHIDPFVEHLKQQQGYSALTASTYKTVLEEAFEFIEIEKEQKRYIFYLTPFRYHIATQHPKTIAKKLSSIRSFVNYLQEQNIKVQLLGDDSIKTPKTLPKPINEEKIKEALQNATPEERFVILLLYTLGLRISELEHIRLEDIKDGWIRIIGKGNKQRELPLLEPIKKMIEEYKEKNQPKIYLFEKNGEKLSQNSLRYLIDKSFKRIGVKVTPHQLRHSFATSLLNEGAPIADVSELLGHASMATTQIYTKLGSNLKKENYLKTHPLCNGDV